MLKVREHVTGHVVIRVLDFLDMIHYDEIKLVPNEKMKSQVHVV